MLGENLVNVNEPRLHEATLNLDTDAGTFSRLSIASVDGKHHLSDVFSALIGFWLLEKNLTFGWKKQAYLESQKY